MITEIDILKFEIDLKKTYERYVYTANLISDQESELQEAFAAALKKEFSIFNGPYVHCTPNYRTLVSLQELIAGYEGLKLAPGMSMFPPEHFDTTQPLYTHQIEALKILDGGENLVVATGTGSGKTECFLLPILDHVLKNPGPGLRAVLIYPMNALADDQLGRLRRLLARTPEVTFGRYTGDTPEKIEEEKRPEGSIPNERYTRREIRENPPHILLTNFAMLEYLLLRPRDSKIFANNGLRFVVLDEAHTYSGAQGIEIALLMRRLQEYLLSENQRLQFILTSATLGDEPDNITKLLKFGEDISGLPFKSTNVLKGELVDEFSDDLKTYPSLEDLMAIGNSSDDFSAWSKALSEPTAICEKLKETGLDCESPESRSTSRILYDLLCTSEPLNTVHETCRKKATTLAELCQILGLPVSDAGLRSVQWLVTMGAFARRSPDSEPLLPTRFHFFVRGLSGATICLWKDCPGKQDHPNTVWSSFYLEDRNVCEHCESNVFPLATCVHCGLPVCRVFLVDGKCKSAPPPRYDPDARLLVWREDFEDAQDELEIPGRRQAWVCLKCGSYVEADEKQACCQEQRLVRLLVLNGDNEGNLSTCPRCGGQSGAFPSVLRDFRTQEDAPTAVLAETVIRSLPFNEDDPNVADLPAHGRNLLIFSDARQRAAFFAPYLEQTTLETAYLGPLVQAIIAAERVEGRPVTFEEVAQAYTRAMDQRRIAVIKERDENNVENFTLIPRRHLRSTHKSKARREAEILLYQNFSASYRSKTTIPGTATAALTFDFNEQERKTFPLHSPELFAAGEDRGWQGIHALLETFILRKAIDFPHYVSTRDLLNPGPTAVTFHLALSGNKDGRQIVRWNPYLAPEKQRKRAVSLSRQLWILTRLTELDPTRDASELENLLTNLWKLFQESVLIESETWPGEFRIDPSVIQVTSQATWGVCNRCGRVTTLTDLGFCMTRNCKGSIKELSEEARDRLFQQNHYRQRYFLDPLAIVVKEHTAQLTNEYGKEYQRRFMLGEINALSSSTTFEMGVDVGALKAVLLRNVPPTTSSYIQRAGRAGRRKDGVSVALTFCRNVPHDQYHYQFPEAIILGKVPAPYLNIRNRPLTQRHCNSLLLGYFLRDLVGVPSDVLNKLTIESFFLSRSNGSTLANRFESWLDDQIIMDRMRIALQKILPDEAELTPEEAITTAISTLIHDADSVSKKHVEQPLARLTEQKDDLEEQMRGATGRVRIALARSAHSLERLIRQYLDDRLIDFLSSCSWLPGYAFPQDIVKLIVRQAEYGDRMRLERDREIGISEYSPGAEIVADGYLFTSGGIWFNSKEPEIRYYARCPQCRKIDTYHETERPSRSCTRCGTRLSGKFLPRLYIRPDGFTTVVSDSVRLPGRSRRPGARTSEVFLLEGADPDKFQAHALKGVFFAEKKGGRLFLANSGYEFNGYQICRKCGRSFEKPPSNRTHETPWGSRCSGNVVCVDLAHEFHTDILQLRFHGCTPAAPDIRDRSFWLSFVSTFLNGVSDSLNIDASDLGGIYHGWSEESFIGELVVYDRIPGGAGHIRRIVNNLGTVLQAGLERVENCKCPDLEASCYACLRNYGNQFYWEELKRRPVIEWLSNILS